MYKAKGIRDKKGKLVGGAYMMKNRAGDQAITAETGACYVQSQVRTAVLGDVATTLPAVLEVSGVSLHFGAAWLPRSLHTHEKTLHLVSLFVGFVRPFDSVRS